MIDSLDIKNTQGQKKKFLIIDGYGFVFRAFHSLPPLTRNDGLQVGAVYGFTNMLIKQIQNHKYDYIGVMLDSGSKSFRNQIYPAYKANRPPAPPELIHQFPLIRDAVTALGVNFVEKQNFEADDLIATYCRIAKEQNIEVIIASSDKDLMQLIDENVLMYDPMKSKYIKAEQVFEKFGVYPDKLLDLLSMVGDTSDNVPGVPGIGPKTAALLISEFGSLDNILANLDKISQAKRKQTIQENKDNVLLSKTLITLEKFVPVEENLELFKINKVSEEDLNKFLQINGFKSLANKHIAKNDNVVKPQIINNDYTNINSKDELDVWLGKTEISFISLYLETDQHFTIKQIALATSKNRACKFQLVENKAFYQPDLFGTIDENINNGIVLSDFLKIIKNILCDISILKIGFDLKPLFKICLKEGFCLSSFEDLAIMTYLLGKPFTNDNIADFVVNYSDSYNSDDKDICAYAANAIEIYPLLRNSLCKEKLTSLYHRIEKPLIPILAKMENVGIKLNSKLLTDLSEYFAINLKKLEAEIYQLAGREFNIASPKQLGEILFVDLNLATGKKSKKSGSYSTNAEILTKLDEEGVEIAGKILFWRQLAKLKSTYSDSLPKQTDKNSRVHTTFLMNSVNTGRLSSVNPNIQNIPIRTEEGNKIRQAFIADKNCQLISADYSQIELRLLAHIADIGTLRSAFANNQDIHSITASQVFGVDINLVDGNLRRQAKTINFGIIYGISAFGLAKRLGIERNEAATYIERYFEQYPGIKHYMDQTIEFARQHGFVQTIFGRKCYIKGINDRNPNIRQFSERAAINAPLQGSAADIIKIAMLKIDEEFNKQNLSANLILQIHDELIIEAKNEVANTAAKICKSIMENVIKLSIPITVDVGIGDNWQQIH